MPAPDHLRLPALGLLAPSVLPLLATAVALHLAVDWRYELIAGNVVVGIVMVVVLWARRLARRLDGAPTSGSTS